MPLDKKPKILFLVPYVFDKAPGQRFRYEQYLELLSSKGYTYRLESFLDEETNSILYDRGNTFKKMRGIMKGFTRRFRLLWEVPGYNYIFIYREASPLGPPVFEYIIARVFRKKIIYDFDDAIWLSNTSENNRVAANLKWHRKVKSVCKWSYKISAGNRYLADFARRYNPRVVINPTTIDTERMHKPDPNLQKPEIFTIGWTGSHSTVMYLDTILPALDKLIKTHNFKLMVISDTPPAFKRPFLQFVKWSKETEIQDLQRMHVGIMPLTDDIWAQGKCGFKALQYMALGIPALVSPVGVNKSIVDHGVNGYLCGDLATWEKALADFLQNPELINQMSAACRKKVAENYSVQSNQDNFLSLFS